MFSTLNSNQVFILHRLRWGNLIIVKFSMIDFVHHQREGTPFIRFVTSAFVLDTRGFFRKVFFPSHIIRPLRIDVSGWDSLLHGLVQHLDKAGITPVLGSVCMKFSHLEGSINVNFKTLDGGMFTVHRPLFLVDNVLFLDA